MVILEGFPLCVGDVYSIDPTIVYGLGAVKILLCTGSCTYMYLHACPCMYKDMHVCTCNVMHVLVHTL
jgi:hypothetical protein